MNLNSGFLAERVGTSTHLLGPVLSDELSLFFKTRRAHWYYDGPDKNSRTSFFKCQYKRIEEILDNTISHISALDDNPSFSLHNFWNRHVAGSLPATISNLDPLSELLAEHKEIIHKLREVLPLSAKEQHSSAMTDFILDLIEMHQYMTVMLKIQISCSLALLNTIKRKIVIFI